MKRVQLKSGLIEVVFMKEGQETQNFFPLKKRLKKSYHLLTLKDLVALVITTGCPRLQIS
jgi:hypothetical protein